MARPIRVEFPGAVYHVTARGNERRRTFRDDADRQQFLGALEQATKEHALRIHGYCLMPNHYHLLLETPEANLSQAVGWLQTTYTIRFNHRHRRSGHLFQGRFKAHLVEADNYAMELLRYVHLNPVRPRDKTALVPVERARALREYPWSSHRAYLGKGVAPEWLCTDWLAFFGRGRSAARRQYSRFVDDAFGTIVESPWQQLRGGLALGSESFQRKVRALLKGKTSREEVRWVAHSEEPGRRQTAARTLAKQQKQQSWQIWVRVILDGERRIDIAREYGFSDGSGVTQTLKRLQNSVTSEPAARRHMNELLRLWEPNMSSVKS